MKLEKIDNIVKSKYEEKVSNLARFWFWRTRGDGTGSSIAGDAVHMISHS